MDMWKINGTNESFLVRFIYNYNLKIQQVLLKLNGLLLFTSLLYN